jgi:hypothetical protein
MLCIFVWKFCYAIFLRELAGHGHGQDIETDAGTSTKTLSDTQKLSVESVQRQCDNQI